MNKPQAGGEKSETRAIKVHSRIRALVGKEKPSSQVIDAREGVISIYQNTVQIDYHGELLAYSFDKVFPPSTTQRDFFESIEEDLAYSKLSSQTFLTYGHTGSGKTHSIFGTQWTTASDNLKFVTGDKLINAVLQDDNHFGLIQRLLAKLYSLKNSGELVEDIGFSFFQIYNEKIIDLLNPAGEDLQVKLSPVEGVIIDGLSGYTIGTLEESLDVLKKGYLARKLRDNMLNKLSSRSHTIFQISLNMHPSKIAEKQKKNVALNTRVKINLCDLAGSERYMDDIQYTKEHLKELKNINLSLSTLSKVIVQLSNKNYSHFHYRESKLTRVLQDSLDGRTPTILLATLSPTE